MLRQQSQQVGFVGSNISFHTVTYCCQQSLSRCITCHQGCQMLCTASDNCLSNLWQMFGKNVDLVSFTIHSLFIHLNF